MSDGDLLENYAEMPRAESFRRIRKQLGVTQAQLAAAMGTSTKAVQSYEQGWRNVPTRVLVQLFVLLAIHRRRQVDKVPCWDIKHCSVAEREACPSYTIGDGQLCWFVTAGGGCGRAAGDAAGRDDALLPCMGCEVIHRLLRSAGPVETSAPEGDASEPGSTVAPGTGADATQPDQA
jgi:DNA-binding XRE family transcriptional regulator